MRSPVKRLTRTYILALFAVALTAIIGQVVIQATLSNAATDGHAIDLAGRQRMLSERIVKAALLSQNQDLPYADRLIARERLMQAIETLRNTHRAFRFGDVKLDIQPVAQPVMLNLFDELQPLYEELVLTGKEIAAADVEKNVSDKIGALVGQQERYVTLMNDIVVRMSRDAADKVSRSSGIEYLIISITIFLLLFEGFFVFQPAVQQVKRSFERISERETELLESERRHRDLFQYSAGPLLSLNPETGRIISANPAAANALKLSPEQLCGKRFHSFLSHSSAKTFDDCLGKLDTVSEIESQFTINSNDAKCVWASRCVIYRSENEQPYVLLSGHDVTQQVNREQQLILANQRDDLTGLFRRAELDIRIQEMGEQHQSTGAPFSIAMIDIDHFKILNDKYGHQAGDEVLKVISKAVQSSCRHADVVARYGGEELSVLFPHLNCNEAERVSDRIRESVESLNFKMVNESGEECDVTTTVSIGIAGAPTHADDAEELMKAADDAMYQAKCEGRNRVCVFCATAERQPERAKQFPVPAKMSLSPVVQNAPIIIEATEI